MKVLNMFEHLIPKTMSHLRFCILDYPKIHLTNKDAKDLLSDVLTARQMGYQKTSDLYIAIDKLDLIGTHILICDVSNIYTPKVIAGLRLSYNDRCKKHSVDLPMDVNIKFASKEAQDLYKKFKASNEYIVETNGLFIDSNYSYAKTKVDFSQIMMTFVIAYTLRSGYSNFIAATNERYNTSRWIDFGAYPDGHYFVHPQVPDKHKIIFVEKFDNSIVSQRFESFSPELTNAFEVIPSAIQLKSFSQIKAELGDKFIKAA